jgi:hypothetical protein
LKFEIKKDKKLSDTEQKNVLELMTEMLHEQENRSPAFDCAIEALNKEAKKDAKV